MSESAEDITRDILFKATSYIPNEDVAGVVFAAGLIVFDTAWAILGKVFR